MSVEKVYAVDVIFQLFSFGFLALIIFAIVFLFRTVNKRSKEKIELQQKQVDENILLKQEISQLNGRLTKIETLLKEVD